MKQKIFYKVVTFDMCSLTRFPKARLQYQLNEWIYPRIDGSDIMVFDSVKSVENSKLFASKNRCFECEVIKPKRNGIFSIFMINMIKWNDYEINRMSKIFDNITKLKKNKKGYLRYSNYHLAPKGTVFCSAVKLIREINKDDNGTTNIL